MPILSRMSEFLVRNPAIDAAGKVFLASAFVAPSFWIIGDPKRFKHVPVVDSDEFRKVREWYNAKLSKENSYLRQENEKLRMKAQLLKQVSDTSET